MSTTNKKNIILKEVLSSFEGYKKQSKQLKQQANSGSKDDIKTIIELVEEILEQKNCSPIVKLNAIRLIKDCMDTKNQLVIEGFYKSKILQKMHIIAQFQAGNDNEDRGEQYFGLEVDEEVSVIGNSLLRLVLECFMFWPIMLEADQESKNTQISNLFDSLNSQGVQFPQNINYFKSLYKQLTQESQNATNTMKSQSSNPKMDSQEAPKQYGQDEVKEEKSKENSESPKKKKKKELNIKALEEKIAEENIKMEADIQKLGKLLLVPTYLQMNKQAVKEIIDNLQVCSELANTIFQVLEDVQDQINVETLTQYISLNEKTDEIIADYQQFMSSNMKFDDFSIKYGITPTSSNEIKLLSEKELKEQQQQLNFNKNEKGFKSQKLQEQEQDQQLLVVEDLDFDGDSPAYKQMSNVTSNIQSQKRLSQPQILDNTKSSKVSSTRQSQDVIFKKQDPSPAQQHNKNNYKENNYEEYDVPQIQQQIKSIPELQENIQKNSTKIEKGGENNSNQVQIQEPNQQQPVVSQQKQNNQNSEVQYKSLQQNKENTSNNQIDNKQSKTVAPPNSVNNRQPESISRKKQTESENDNDYEYEDDDEYEYQDSSPTNKNRNEQNIQGQLQQNQNEIQKKQQQQQQLSRTEIQNTNETQVPSQTAAPTPPPQQIQSQQKLSKFEDGISAEPLKKQASLQQQSIQQNPPPRASEFKSKSKIEDNEINVLKEKMNTNERVQQQNYQGSSHSIYNEEDIKNIQTLNTEQSQGFFNENKQKKQQNQEGMKASFQFTRQSQNNSMTGSQYDQRGRSSSFKQLFEDPVHLQIMCKFNLIHSFYSFT